VARSSQRIWLIAPLVIVGIPTLLMVGVWLYMLWANRVPPFRPPAVALPQPNGYTRAAAIAARLPREPMTSHGIGGAPWPDLPPGQLRAALPPARPGLDQLRSTFRLEWRVPLVPITPQKISDLDRERDMFARSARYFLAESRLTAGQADYVTAMHRQLDAVELGAKLPWGGTLWHGLDGLAYQAMGLAGTKRLISALATSATPTVLKRVRRIRASSPRFADVLEGQRVYLLSILPRSFESYQNMTLAQTLNLLWQPFPDAWGSGNRKNRFGLSAEILRSDFSARGFAFTPKQRAFRNFDTFVRQVITESKKPFRQRRPVRMPNHIISQQLLEQLIQAETKWWRPETELALLEAALAVEIYQREHGAYPRRLSEIPRRWLPTIPQDPWGQPLVYRLRKGKPLLYSLGPDGKDDGALAVLAQDISRNTQGDLVFDALGSAER
jgi:hypothetical protein